MYADKNYYLNTYCGKNIEDNPDACYIVTKGNDNLVANTDNNGDIERMLKKASRQIDTLTFNRIRAVGFDNLTAFQKEIIQEVTCEFADFLYENQDTLESIYSSYSINGVSATIGESWNLKIQNGIAIPTHLYQTLSQTGLTCKNLRW